MPVETYIRELQRRIALYDDEAAYREIFLFYYKSLMNFAGSFVVSRELAEEVVSDVFIKLWQNRKSIEEIGNLRVYLYISTKNTSLNYIAKHQKHRTLSIDDLVVEIGPTAIDPEQIMITAEMRRRIELAIAELPPRCKIIFKLIREDGLRYKEVAEILNISVKTIDNQLAIALKKISNAIGVKLKVGVK
jgi:RNA polymerase sigma-70 factor (family 1)